MGNVACCADSKDEKHSAAQPEELARAEAVPVVDDGGMKQTGSSSAKTYCVVLDKENGTKLGLDVDFMAEREWNCANPDAQLCTGDSIVEAIMLEKCKNDKVLKLTLVKALTHDFLVSDLEQLINTRKCGPILIRLSWHDAGVFSKGELTGGCPNAAMRFGTSAGEGAFDANLGLPTVALALLAPISEKYDPLRAAQGLASHYCSGRLLVWPEF